MLDDRMEQFRRLQQVQVASSPEASRSSSWACCASSSWAWRKLLASGVGRVRWVGAIRVAGKLLTPLPVVARGCSRCPTLCGLCRASPARPSVRNARVDHLEDALVHRLRGDDDAEPSSASFRGPKPPALRACSEWVVGMRQQAGSSRETSRPGEETITKGRAQTAVFDRAIHVT